MPTPSFDAIVVGGGHNGLAAAALLGKAGRRVLLLEASDAVGGAARTVELAPGFRVPEVAHLANRLHPEVVRRLELERHGLAFATTNLSTTSLSADGRSLTLAGAFGERLEGDIADGERAAWSALRGKLLRFAGVLAPFLSQIPPRLKNGGVADMMTLGKLGLGIRRLGRDDMREFLRMVLMNIADVLDEEVTDERLRAAVAFDAVLGTSLGPRSPNSLMTLFYRLAGEAGGVQAANALPRGGMGAVIAALASAAQAAGVVTRTGAPVASILVEDDRAAGVVLASGEEIRAPLVASAMNPVATLLQLVGTRHLDTGLVRRLSHVRAKGTVAKLNLALDGPPPFIGLSPEALAGRLLTAPSLQAIESAFDDAKYGRFSAEPALEITVPSASDPSLAPAGKHVVSINAIYAPFRLKPDSEAGREGFEARILAVLERHAPGIGGRIVARDFLTPADIERRHRIPGGHWHHGELGIDQMFMLRPVLGLAQYTTPVEGLVLCGAGSHPGGGVSGAPALNAVSRILADSKGSGLFAAARRARR
jgi:phytoene dehydrogenase-like protein